MKTSKRPKRDRRQAIRKIRRNPNENEQKIPLYVVGRHAPYEGFSHIAVYDNALDAMSDVLAGKRDYLYEYSATRIVGPVYFGDDIIDAFRQDGDDLDDWVARDPNRMAALSKLRELESRAMSYGDD
jgi:hypothetical protein